MNGGDAAGGGLRGWPFDRPGQCPELEAQRVWLGLLRCSHEHCMFQAFKFVEPGEAFCCGVPAECKVEAFGTAEICAGLIIVPDDFFRHGGETPFSAPVWSPIYERAR